MKAMSLVLGCLALFSFQFSTASSSSPEDQYCSNEKFYCPENDQCSCQCYDRALRCISARVCLDSNGNEAKCYGRFGVYNYYKKKSPLSSLSSSSKKRSIEDFKHWFVQYRGFVYEFGKSYGVQELDVNDPNYKYGSGKVKVVSERMGRSSCTRDQIIRFNEKWLEANPKYKLFTNNCQDFATKLLKELRNNCAKNNENLKAQCSVTSATIPRMIFNWKLYALFGPLITFAILHIN